MFWGEFEFGVLSTLSPAKDLPHVWPTSGLIGFETDTCLNCIIVGCLKLLAISFTVCGGFRGGFIFPFFTAGASLGRALCFVFPTLSPVIATLCFAAGINVAITRTARKLCKPDDHRLIAFLSHIHIRFLFSCNLAHSLLLEWRAICTTRCIDSFFSKPFCNWISSLYQISVDSK